MPTVQHAEWQLAGSHKGHRGTHAPVQHVSLAATRATVSCHRIIGRYPNHKGYAAWDHKQQWVPLLGPAWSPCAGPVRLRSWSWTDGRDVESGLGVRLSAARGAARVAAWAQGGAQHGRSMLAGRGTTSAQPPQPQTSTLPI